MRFTVVSMGSMFQSRMYRQSKSTHLKGRVGGYLSKTPILLRQRGGTRLTITTDNDQDFRRPGLKVFNPVKEFRAASAERERLDCRRCFGDGQPMTVSKSLPNCYPSPRKDENARKSLRQRWIRDLGVGEPCPPKLRRSGFKSSRPDY